MTIKIKQAFPRILLALGLVTVLLVSTPWGASIDDLNFKVGGFGKTLSQYVREIDNIPADREINWDYKVDVNSKTGEIKIVRTSLPNSPAFRDMVVAPSQITEVMSYNVNTGEYSIRRSEKSENGWVDNEVWKGNKYKNNSFHKAEETHIKADGRKQKIEYDSNGQITSETKWDSKGRLTSYTVYTSSGQTVTFQHDPETGKRTTQIVKNADNSSTTTVFGPDGEVAYVTNCDRNGNCKTELKKGFARELKQQQQTLVERPDVLGDRNVMEAIAQPRERFIGGKERLQADVLQPMEGKPLGDLGGVREKTKSRALDQSKIGSLDLGPLQAKPRTEIPGGLKERPRTGARERIKQTRDVPVSINSDGFLPATPAARLGAGTTPVNKKIQTGRVPTMKDTTKLESLSFGRKEQFRGTPRSQSVNQAVQGVDFSKKKLLTEVAQSFKGKARTQEFNKPAGSSSAYPGLR